MNKSSLVILVGLGVAGVLFMYGKQDVATTDMGTAIEVSSAPVAVTEDPLANIEPAAGSDVIELGTGLMTDEETTSITDENIVEDVEEVLSIEKDVTDMIEKGQTATTDGVEGVIGVVEENVESTLVEETTGIVEGVKDVKEDVKEIETKLAE